MKLRIAKKIMANIVAGCCHYSEAQLRAAVQRFERTKTSKDADVFWDSLMRVLGVEGRAEMLAHSGAPGTAFDLLMRADW